MRRIRQRIVCSSIIVFLLSFSLRGATNESHKLVVIAPRALDDALALLQENLDCVITFEDSPYEASSRIQDLFPGGPRVPKERSLIFEYQEGQEPMMVIRSLLDAYRKVDATAVFSLQSDSVYERMFHVFPVRYVRDDGTWADYRSSLDESITFAEDQGTSWADSIQHLCRILSRQGTGIVYAGGFRGGPSIAPTARTNTTARAFLTYMTHDRKRVPDGCLISWTIRRGPHMAASDDFAVFALSRVVPVNRAQGTTCMIVESQRPLSTGLRTLGNILGCTIMYEDIEYARPRDVLSDKTGKPRVPSGGRLKYRFNTGTNALEAIAGCVKAYNEQNGAGIFAAKSVGASIHVFPTVARDANGDLTHEESLLDHPVSPQGARQTAADYVDQIVKEIGVALKKQIACGKLPAEIIAQEASPLKAIHQVASVVLSDLTARTGKKLFWQVHYDLEDKKFVLSGY